MSSFEKVECGWFDRTISLDKCTCWGVCKSKLSVEGISYSNQLLFTKRQKENLAILTGEDKFKKLNEAVTFFVSTDEIEKLAFRDVIAMFDDKNDILEMLFNSNSIDLISNGYLNRYKSSLARIEEFTKRVSNLGLDTHCFLIDSTAVLALYGIRPMGDIDFLTNIEYPVGIENGSVENNDKYIKYHSVDTEMLINNPRYHLLYKGVKVISLEELFTWKSNKGTKKDIEDVRLIIGFNSGKLLNCLYRRVILIKREIKIIAHKIYRLMIHSEK